MTERESETEAVYFTILMVQYSGIFSCSMAEGAMADGWPDREGSVLGMGRVMGRLRGEQL